MLSRTVARFGTIRANAYTAFMTKYGHKFPTSKYSGAMARGKAMGAAYRKLSSAEKSKLKASVKGKVYRFSARKFPKGTRKPTKWNKFVSKNWNKVRGNTGKRFQAIAALWRK